jgi:FAD/FMN-containing dehydrogenase
METLRAALGPKGVLIGAEVEPFATDWRGMFHGAPLCVARPATTDQVAAVVRACAQAGVAIAPQGGNTGLAGGATPQDGAVVLSLGRMTAIRDLDPVGLTVTAEAGAPLLAVKQAAEAAGRLLPISLAAEGTATIGGVVSTNAGGINVLRYGMTRALTLGLEVVLPDGTVVDGLRRLRKDNAGPDWAQLFIGAEGTLGAVTAAVLRLAARPRHTVTALLSCPDPDACLCLFDRAVTELGDSLQAFELISGESLALVARHGGPAAPGEPAPWRLLIEAGATFGGLAEAAEGLMAAAFEEGWATDGVLASSQAQAAALWALRERITEAEARDGPSAKHDVSVPLTAVPEFLRRLPAALAAAAPAARPNVFGHLGDGNLHANVLLSPDCDAGAVTRAVHDLTHDLGGSISAEHGLGQYRVAEWMRLTPAGERRLAGLARAALDPRGLMNPGKGAPAARGAG